MDEELIIEGKPYSIQKGAVRVLSLRRELIDEILDLRSEIHEIERSHVHADLLTFIQRPHSPSLNLPYFMEWDNRAILEIKSHDEWFKNKITKQTRTSIRKSERKGVVTCIESATDQLVDKLVEIFNETETRQGRPNRYYGWDSERVRHTWMRDLDKTLWIGAYCGEEMIGFIKLIVGEGIARTSGTVAKIGHRDKAPMNALFSKAVEICASKDIPLIVYGQFTYGRKGEDSLTEFKIHNGFKRFNIPRWYVPLSVRGKIGFNLGLHRDLIDLVPGPIYRVIRNIKSKWYERL